MTSDTAPGKPPGRNLRWALIASLALNVLIVGGVGASLVPHFWKRGHRAPGLLGFAQTLPPERGSMIREKVQGERATFDALRKEEREARKAARSVLIEEPFDAAKFKAALDRAATADDKESRTRMSLLVETATELTPEERRQLHDWFEKHRKRGRHHRRDKPSE